METHCWGGFPVLWIWAPCYGGSESQGRAGKIPRCCQERKDQGSRRPSSYTGLSSPPKYKPELPYSQPQHQVHQLGINVSTLLYFKWTTNKDPL